jgi:hypothetical protein
VGSHGRPDPLDYEPSASITTGRELANASPCPEGQDHIWLFNTHHDTGTELQCQIRLVPMTLYGLAQVTFQASQ